MLGGRHAIATAVVLVLLGASAPTANATTATFTIPGQSTWPVPADVSSARFSVTGAGGGNAVVGPSTILGGRGGTTVGTLDVTPAAEYEIRIGTRGEDSDAPGTPGEGGAFGGGTAAHAGPCATFTCSGAGGGGAAIVSLGLPNNQANVLLLGAGGGGAGYDPTLTTTGGDGGGLVGQAGGTDMSCTAAAGGNQDGTTGSGQYIDGEAGQGDAGGGGGAGWRGGAGGAAAGAGEGCGGGGGSGHLAEAVRSGSFPLASNTGDASVAITYFTLTVTVSGQGSVTGTGISCGAAGTDCTESFAPGDVVSLSATPSDGMQFDGFSGACSGPTCQATVAADGTIAAAFSRPPIAPQTTISKAPPKKTTKKKVKISFTSSIAGSTFECRLDKKPFKSCSSPFTAKAKKGRHRFQVRAIGPTGLTDPTPATASWKVKKKRKNR
jgi:hypothetical protein